MNTIVSFTPEGWAHVAALHLLAKFPCLQVRPAEVEALLIPLFIKAACHRPFPTQPSLPPEKS